MRFETLTRASRGLKTYTTKQIQQSLLPMGPPPPGHTDPKAYYAAVARGQWREYSARQRVAAWAQHKSLDLLTPDVRAGVLAHTVFDVHPVTLHPVPSLKRAASEVLTHLERGVGSLSRRLSVHTRRRTAPAAVAHAASEPRDERALARTISESSIGPEILYVRPTSVEQVPQTQTSKPAVAQVQSKHVRFVSPEPWRDAARSVRRATDSARPTQTLLPAQPRRQSDPAPAPMVQRRANADLYADLPPTLPLVWHKKPAAAPVAQAVAVASELTVVTCALTHEAQAAVAKRSNGTGAATPALLHLAPVLLKIAPQPVATPLTRKSLPTPPVTTRHAPTYVPLTRDLIIKDLVGRMLIAMSTKP